MNFVSLALHINATPSGHIILYVDIFQLFVFEKGKICFSFKIATQYEWTFSLQNNK